MSVSCSQIFQVMVCRVTEMIKNTKNLSCFSLVVRGMNKYIIFVVRTTATIRYKLLVVFLLLLLFFIKTRMR
jgi:hypothetical protein